MFEKSKPVPHGVHDRETLEESGRDRVAGGADSQPARTGDALRAIEWSELTARLNAARDLRRELREDAMLCAGASGASFGDAAASFFKNLGPNNPAPNKTAHDERHVNLEDLEAFKASCGRPDIDEGSAAIGDARDEL